MYKLLGGLKDYLKWQVRVGGWSTWASSVSIQLQDIVTDNAIFRIHNVFTAVLLMTFSVIITANQFVGNPISCIVKGVPTHPVNTYCWITSTFTMPDAFRREVGIEVAHPGVANDHGEEAVKRYHSYYQWVCFVLFFQVRNLSLLAEHTRRVLIVDSIGDGLIIAQRTWLRGGCCRDLWLYNRLGQARCWAMTQGEGVWWGVNKS